MSDVPVAAPSAPAAASPSASPSSTPSSSPSVSPGSQASPAASSGSPSVPAAKASSGVPDAKLPFQEGSGTDNAHPDAKPGETKAETIQRLKFKVKVNGKESEREFTNEEAQLHIQKGLGAEERFAEAAEVRKTFAALQKALKENPFEALKDPAFGIDLKQIAIEHLAKEFEAEEMQKANPQQYELDQYKAKVAAFEAKEKAAVDAKQAAVQAEQDRRAWDEMKKGWNSALNKAGFAENEGFHRQLAEIGRDFLDAGLDLNPELLVAEFKNRLGQQNKMLFGGLKGEALINALGDDLVNEVLSFKVSQINSTRKQEPLVAAEAPVAPKSEEEFEKSDRPTKYLRNYRDFLRDE